MFSEEGTLTTQGDTGAMGMYACSLMPFVEYMKHRHNTPNITDHQRNHLVTSHLIWNKFTNYADDAAGAGKL